MMLKTFAKTFLTASAAMTLSVAANAYSIDDTYIGGNDNSWGDVIGHTHYFDTLGADVAVNGSNVSIDVHTNFTNPDAIGSYRGLTYGRTGIGMGDLFLSNTYTPYGSASDGYINDNAFTGNLWTYGLALDNPFSTTGGNAYLYALNGATNDENALLSDDFLRRGVYRNGQEVAVDVDSDTTEFLNIVGSWTVDDLTNTISFDFDAAGTDLLSTGSLAMHWGMMCGNDVIEGIVDYTEVNEPGTLALIGLGAFGLFAARRRIK